MPADVKKKTQIFNILASWAEDTKVTGRNRAELFTELQCAEDTAVWDFLAPEADYPWYLRLTPQSSCLFIPSLDKCNC